MVNRLVAVGIEPGDRVYLAVRNRIDYLAAQFGISLAGNAAVVASPIVESG